MEDSKFPGGISFPDNGPIWNKIIEAFWHATCAYSIAADDLGKLPINTTFVQGVGANSLDDPGVALTYDPRRRSLTLAFEGSFADNCRLVLAEPSPDNQRTPWYLKNVLPTAKVDVTVLDWVEALCCGPVCARGQSGTTTLQQIIQHITGSACVPSEGGCGAEFMSQECQVERVLVCGYCLGGAMSILAAPWVALLLPRAPVRCITFGAPARAGNTHFSLLFKLLVGLSYQVAYRHDPAPVTGRNHHPSFDITPVYGPLYVDDTSARPMAPPAAMIHRVEDHYLFNYYHCVLNTNIWPLRNLPEWRIAPVCDGKLGMMPRGGDDLARDGGTGDSRDPWAEWSGFAISMLWELMEGKLLRLALLAANNSEAANGGTCQGSGGMPSSLSFTSSSSPTTKSSTKSGDFDSAFRSDSSDASPKANRRSSIALPTLVQRLQSRLLSSIRWSMPQASTHNATREPHRRGGNPETAETLGCDKTGNSGRQGGITETLGPRSTPSVGSVQSGDGKVAVGYPVLAIQRGAFFGCSNGCVPPHSPNSTTNCASQDACSEGCSRDDATDDVGDSCMHDDDAGNSQSSGASDAASCYTSCTDDSEQGSDGMEHSPRTHIDAGVCYIKGCDRHGMEGVQEVNNVSDTGYPGYTQGVDQGGISLFMDLYREVIRMEEAYLEYRRSRGMSYPKISRPPFADPGMGSAAHIAAPFDEQTEMAHESSIIGRDSGVVAPSPSVGGSSQQTVHACDVKGCEQPNKRGGGVWGALGLISQIPIMGVALTRSWRGHSTDATVAGRDSLDVDVLDAGVAEDVNSVLHMMFPRVLKPQEMCRTRFDSQLAAVLKQQLQLPAVLSSAAYTREQEFRKLTGLQCSRMLKDEASGSQVHVAWEARTRTAIFAFRGTSSATDALSDLKFLRKQCNFLPSLLPGAKVHSGFSSHFAAVTSRGRKDGNMGDVLEVLSAGLKPNVVLCCGHSLGGALATLGATWCSLRYPHASISCVTFGSPRVGNSKFVRAFQTLVGSSIRVVNKGDLITRLPPPYLRYEHVDAAVHITDSGFIIGEDRAAYRNNVADHAVANYMACCCSTDVMGHM